MQDLMLTHDIFSSGNEYVTNLPLQMALFFNIFFAPFWLATVIVAFEVKVSIDRIKKLENIIKNGINVRRK